MKKRQILTLGLSVAMTTGMMAGVVSANAAEDPVTLKWIQVGGGMPKTYDEWLDQINPYLEEKIGVNVEMEIVPWATGITEEMLSQTQVSILISCLPIRTVMAQR